MQQEGKIELQLEDKYKEQLIIQIFQEIQEQILVDNNDILDDLNPLISQLNEKDRNKVLQSINRYFSDHDFVKLGNFLIQEENQEKLDYQQMYNLDRKNKNYESIFYNIKITKYRIENKIPESFLANICQLQKIQSHSLMIFDLLDYSLDQKELSQVEILKILLELFYSVTLFDQNELSEFEKLIGSLLTKQLYEINFYTENLKKKDPLNYEVFVQFLQQTQLKIINDSNPDLQLFLQKNKQYYNLFMTLNKEILNSRKNLQLFISSLTKVPVEHSKFNQIEVYLNCIENVDEKLNDLYLQIVFFYWKQYCLKFNLQIDLKSQEESLQNIANERKFIFIERYLKKQQSNTQDKIFLFVVHRICYFIQEGDKLLDKNTFRNFQDQMNEILKVNNSINQAGIEIFIKDKVKFFEFWKRIHLLKFYNKINPKENNTIADLITNLLWINGQSDDFYDIIKTLFNQKNKTLQQLVLVIDKAINEKRFQSHFKYSSIQKKNFLRIIQTQFPKEVESFFLLKKLLQNFENLNRAQLILEAQKFINNSLNNESINFFSKLGIKFNVIQIVFSSQTLEKLASKILEFMFSNKKVNIYECLLSLKSIFAIQQLLQQEQLQFFQILTFAFSLKVLEFLIIKNKGEKISLTVVKWTMCAILALHKKIDSHQLQIVKKQIYLIFKDKFYNFPLIFDCLESKISIQKVNQIVQLQYYFNMNEQDNYLKISQKIFELDEQLYEQWFKMKKPPNVMLSIEYLRIKKIQQHYPKNMNISLENFNISLSEYNEEEQKVIIENWILDMNNSQKFQQILPLFFNIIKRGESSTEMLILINSILQQNKQIQLRIGSLNLKSLFQIFYNNANEELRVILMKFFCKEYPIPFLYQNPIQDNIQQKSELFILNSNLYYLIDYGYTIINLSFSLNQKKIGKTELINEIFYKREKFETSDTCKMNQDTIDIMFDFEFKNTRNYIIADVHGIILPEILVKLIPFFNLWIVQMDSESELEENFNQTKMLLSTILLKTIKFEICFLVRNSNDQELIKNQNIIQDIKKYGIKILHIPNLRDIQIDRQFKINQIENVSKFLFNCILDHQKFIHQNIKPVQSQQIKFLRIFEQSSKQYSININQIKHHYKLISKIQDKLNQIVTNEDGFYNQNSFPIRGIQWKIKKLRNQNYELCMNSKENKAQIDKVINEIQNLEKQILKQEPTDLLKLFCEIFSQNNYYVVYLWIVDQIRDFNQKNLINLQKTDQQLNEQFNQLKQEKDQLKQKYHNDLSKLCEDEKNNEIKQKMKKLKKEMDSNAQDISKKNVGIELFWRELISLRKSNKQFNFDPIETLSQLIRKGESLEFLDGDTLQIDTKFLFDLANKTMQNKQQKTLVISILGPQSSGKSTILNKIFGCHFWASVGRCTKGIHLQILQVQNKQIFQNYFDQILILDTEGLQNPNQIDPEFDKKISLFVLSISDIIMINVKGEMNLQFKSLVEMCIFTLGHLKKGLSMVKQLSWFFNQNDNYKDIQPFRSQIKDLSSKLNLQWNENYIDQQEEYINYADILDIQANIQGLGFASDQKDWSKNGWNQSVNNHTFSREAYQQGISMIKQYILKIKDQSYLLNDFNHFLQNVQIFWESIEKLPDLLEFSELIQHQQNLIMKQYYDELLKNQEITQVHKELIQETQKKIQNQKQKTLDFFKQIQIEQESEIESKYTQFKSQILEKMNTFKNENKIQKKIQQKYINKLEDQINSEQVAFKVGIQDIIAMYEGEYQQKKGYVLIDNFIQKVLNDQNLKQKLQGNDQLITQEFDKIWNKLIKESNQAQEQQFQDILDSHYKAIKSISNHYNLNTKNEKEYFSFFMDRIIQKNPNDIQNSEEEWIFTLFKKELSETEQFITLDNNKQNLAYLDIFHQNIKEKIEKSKDQILDLQQFFSQEIIYCVVAKNKVQDYLDIHFEGDFKDFQNKYKDSKSLKTHFYNFLSFLNYFQITYDQKKKEKLENLINKPTFFDNLQNLIFGKGSQVYEEFCDLKATLNFNNYQKEIDLSSSHIVKTFKDTYKNLKCYVITDNSWNNNIQFKEDLLKTYIIIESQNKIKVSLTSCKESFDYIMESKNKTPPFFSQIFPKQFNQIMIDKNGWAKLYKELYNLIKQEIVGNNSKLAYQDSGLEQDRLCYLDKNKQVENFQQFNQYLITNIMQKVQNKIKVQYNNQFAQFGVILTDVGERCINYYSMLIIWRFICYQRWSQRKINFQHENNRKNELDRCIAEINEDNLKQGCIKAKEVVSKISTLLKNKFVERTKNEVFQKIKNKSMSNVELIAQLDNKILTDENDFKNESFQQTIISYTTDHKSYINKYTNDLIMQLRNELQAEYFQQYRNELIKYLVDVQKNAKVIFKYVQGQKKEVKTIKYFIEEENQKDKSFYENYLFSLVIQCLHGQIYDNFDIIENQYQEIFQVSNFNNIISDLNLNWGLINIQNQQIYNLKSFIETVIQQIDLIKNNNQLVQFNLNEYQVEVELEKVKLQMNGCEFTCPCCKRKCDQNNDNLHQHQCQNGHQIRGINGIMITKNSPSLYTCEELNDKCKLKTLETNVVKTWKEVKQAHSQWDFQNLDNTKNKKKWENIWNKGLGKLICSYLEKQSKHEIIFSQKLDLEKMVLNTHYILILDDSGSMKGPNWDNAKNGALKCIKSIMNQTLAKISVIIFNQDARIVVECEKPQLFFISPKIQYQGGNTLFEPPFQKALTLIQKYQKFDKIQILFYTDGHAGYPEDIINQFCLLPVEIRQIINLVACSGEKMSNSLALIIEKFQTHMQYAELRNAVLPTDLSTVWTEVVSLNFHNQLA